MRGRVVGFLVGVAVVAGGLAGCAGEVVPDEVEPTGVTVAEACEALTVPMEKWTWAMSMTSPSSSVESTRATMRGAKRYVTQIAAVEMPEGDGDAATLRGARDEMVSVLREFHRHAEITQTGDGFAEIMAGLAGPGVDLGRVCDVM